jgi:lipoprotein-anchoring transpeptidase ErfK/SrfK
VTNLTMRARARLQRATLAALAVLATVTVAPTTVPASATEAVSAVERPIAQSAGATGYWLFALDGGVFSFGSSAFQGSMGGRPLNAPVVGMASTPSGSGYWMVATDGGVFAFGDAPFTGSMGGRPLNAPVVGLVPTRSGNGYWMVATDGGVFAFGDASFVGSLGGQSIPDVVIGLAGTPSANGYWMLDARGRVRAFGDAVFHGDLGGDPPAPVATLAATPSGRGYWIVTIDGSVYAYGDARTAAATQPVPSGSVEMPAVGIVPTASGNGYWIVRSDGAVTPHGDAPAIGDMAGTPLQGAVVGLATRSGSSTGGATLAMRYGDAMPGFSSSDGFSGSLVAAAQDGQLTVRAARGGGQVSDLLSNPVPTTRQELHLLVKRIVGNEAEVYLNRRPNGATGWVSLNDVDLLRTDKRILIDVGARRLTVFESNTPIFSTSIGVGKPSTPTPTGRYFLTELWQQPSSSGPFGPYAYGLSAYSDVLEQFNGGPGQTGIHGTNAPQLIGGAPSNGCIRLPNSAIVHIVQTIGLPLGTPVDIV